MGLFSKFRETAVDGSEQRGEECGGDQAPVAEGSGVDDSPGREKPLLESVGEIFEHTVHNVREAVFGHAMDGTSVGAVGTLPCALAMEDPFSQSDHVLNAVVEHDVRSSGVISDGSRVEENVSQKKTIVQTVRENLAHSAHKVREAVLCHTTDREPNGNQFAQAATPIENGDNVTSPVPDHGTDDHSSTTVVETMGDKMSQTVKEIVNGSHNAVVESASAIDPSTTIPDEPGPVIDDPGKPLKEHSEEDEEVKGFIQTVKEAAHEVKEEMMEVVQEVKDVVLSNDTLPNVQTESITEDAGERPSMELVHTIVHD